MEKDLIAGASDQGQSSGMYTDPAVNQNYQFIPDTPPSQQNINDNLESSFIDENDHNIPYTEQPRAYGDGELRIGTYLSLNEDIYSLGFASMLRNEIVDEAILPKDDDHQNAKNQAKTPKGGNQKVPDFDHDEFDSQIYEDEQRH